MWWKRNKYNPLEEKHYLVVYEEDYDGKKKRKVKRFSKVVWARDKHHAITKISLSGNVCPRIKEIAFTKEAAEISMNTRRYIVDVICLEE